MSKAKRIVKGKAGAAPVVRGRKIAAMTEPTKGARELLRNRWLTKVERVKGTQCQRWTGAHSKTRNGTRGIIRVGDASMSALRVGKALADGLPLTAPQVRTGRLVHKGAVLNDRAAQKVHRACINPAHYAWDQRQTERSDRRGTNERRTTKRRAGVSA